jgi:hypothetical protein
LLFDGNKLIRHGRHRLRRTASLPLAPSCSKNGVASLTLWSPGYPRFPSRHKAGHDGVADSIESKTAPEVERLMRPIRAVPGNRKRLLNLHRRSGKISTGTQAMESPDGLVMNTIPTPATDGLKLTLAIALFAACSVNLVLLSFWL